MPVRGIWNSIVSDLDCSRMSVDSPVCKIKISVVLVGNDAVGKNL